MACNNITIQLDLAYINGDPLQGYNATTTITGDGGQTINGTYTIDGINDFVINSTNTENIHLDLNAVFTYDIIVGNCRYCCILRPFDTEDLSVNCSPVGCPEISITQRLITLTEPIQNAYIRASVEIEITGNDGCPIAGSVRILDVRDITPPIDVTDPPIVQTEIINSTLTSFISNLYYPSNQPDTILVEIEVEVDVCGCLYVYSDVHELTNDEGIWTGLESVKVLDNFPCPEIQGCTNPDSSNYNPDATIDDGSCIDPDCEQTIQVPDCSECDDSIEVMVQPSFADNGNNEYLFDVTVLDRTDVIQIRAFVDGTSYTINLNSGDFPQLLFNHPVDINATTVSLVIQVTLDDTCVYTVNQNLDAPISETEFVLTANNFGCDNFIEIPVNNCGCTDPNAINYNPQATLDDGSCVYQTLGGCTDPLAENYNPNAEVDDGSCQYCVGCTDSNASNYNPNAVVNDNSCIYISGCTDPNATNYLSGATIDDGSCECDNVKILLGTSPISIPTGGTEDSCVTLSTFNMLVKIDCADILDCFEDCNSDIFSLLQYFTGLAIDFSINEVDDCDNIISVIKTYNIYNFECGESGLYFEGESTSCANLANILKCELEEECGCVEFHFSPSWKNIEILLQDEDMVGKNVQPSISFRNFGCTFCVLIDEFKMERICNTQVTECINIDNCINFNVELDIDNKKSHVLPEGTNSKQILNTKYLDLEIDVVKYIDNQIIDFHNQCGVNINEKELISVTDNSDVLASIYQNYLNNNITISGSTIEQCNCPITDKLNYDIVPLLNNNIDHNIINMIEQVIPSTSLWESFDNIYTNMLFHRQYYDYQQQLDFNCDLNYVISGCTDENISGITFECIEYVSLCNFCSPTKSITITGGTVCPTANILDINIIDPIPFISSGSSLDVCAGEDYEFQLFVLSGAVLDILFFDGVEICKGDTAEFDCYYVKYLGNGFIKYRVKKEDQCCNTTLNHSYRFSIDAELFEVSFTINVGQCFNAGNNNTAYLCISDL